MQKTFFLLSKALNEVKNSNKALVSSEYGEVNYKHYTIPSKSANVYRKRYLKNGEEIKMWKELAYQKRRNIIVELEQNYDSSELLTSKLKEHKVISPKKLWEQTKYLVDNRDARRFYKTAVTGSEIAIRRIWHEYKITPNVIYVPYNWSDNGKSDIIGNNCKECLPKWCFESLDNPTVIVRCEGADVNRALLSAELNDGFAAEFPIVFGSPNNHESEKVFIPNLHPHFLLDSKFEKLESVVVIHQGRNPGNIGIIIRAAEKMGYDAVILDRCADKYNEKVIRASEGAIFSPRLKIFELNGRYGMNSSEEVASYLQQVCLKHSLLPLVSVPSQKATPIFEIARKLYSNCYLENQSKQCQNEIALLNKNSFKGSLLMLGSESEGLINLITAWEKYHPILDKERNLRASSFLPYQAVSLPMFESTVSSINLSVAGTIMMNYLKPKAKKEFGKLFELGIAKREQNQKNTAEVETKITENEMINE